MLTTAPLGDGRALTRAWRGQAQRERHPEVLGGGVRELTPATHSETRAPSTARRPGAGEGHATVRRARRGRRGRGRLPCPLSTLRNNLVFVTEGWGENSSPWEPRADKEAAHSLARYTDVCWARAPSIPGKPPTSAFRLCLFHRT